jgi:hypothetical protein
MALIFQELPPSSPLRRLVVDAFATFWTPEDHARCKLDVVLFGRLPQELSFRAFSLLTMKRDNSALMERLHMPCAYHEHDETEAARDACLVKHENLHQRKYEELNRAQQVWEAISGVTRGV